MPPIPYSLLFYLLADACLRLSRLNEAIPAMDMAITKSNETGERWWQAEMYRLRGVILMAKASSRGAADSDLESAETCLAEALRISRKQEAKSLELKAAVSLAELYKYRGNSKQGYTLLTSVLSWFSEGQDSVDYRRAEALLAKF